MNKYQEALDRITEIYYDCDGFYGFESVKKCDCSLTKTCFRREKNIKLLQELVDQTKTPTLEEVKKEWEALGYTFETRVDDYHNGMAYTRYIISIRINGNKRLIILKKYDKSISLNYYWEVFDREGYKVPNYERFDTTLQEHQLLTKTFRALKWMD